MLCSLSSAIGQSINHAVGDVPYVSLKKESQALTPFVTRNTFWGCIWNQIKACC